MSSGLPRWGSGLATHVYAFEEGNASMRDLLGGKGAGLAEMTHLGLPVPPGFTITTKACNAYTRTRRFPPGMWRQVEQALSAVEAKRGRKFGDPANLLLVSVRSGARESMLGMMDTILNLGLNDQTVQGLIARTQNPRFAYDCYRRFVQMYGDVVLGLKPQEKHERDPFEVILEHKKESRRVRFDTDLTAEDLKELVAAFKAEIKTKLSKSFPEDPLEQLWGAIGAV